MMMMMMNNIEKELKKIGFEVGYNNYFKTITGEELKHYFSEDAETLDLFDSGEITEAVIEVDPESEFIGFGFPVGGDYVLQEDYYPAALEKILSFKTFSY
jgi:hypothetical protein